MLIYWARRMRWAGNVKAGGDMRNEYKILAGKSGVQMPVGESRRIWQNNIQTNLRETGWEIWSGLIWSGWEPVEGSYKHNNETSGNIKRREFLD
jgi:hypothetical protein